MASTVANIIRTVADAQRVAAYLAKTGGRK